MEYDGNLYDLQVDKWNNRQNDGCLGGVGTIFTLTDFELMVLFLD